jgi:type 1 fimbria pilin
MNCPLALKRIAASVLSVGLIVSACAAQAQNSVLEIHGVITTPGCRFNPQTALQLNQQTHIKGQACGLTSGVANPLSSLNIVHIEQQTLLTSMGTAGKQLVTLTYR